MSLLKNISPTWMTSLYWLCASTIIATLIGIYYADGKISIHSPASTDLYKFYLSGVRMNHGVSMYWHPMPAKQRNEHCFNINAVTQPTQHASTIKHIDETDCLHPNLNLPIFGLLSLAITKMTFRGAWLTWSLAGIACALMSLKLICAHLRPTQSRHFPIFYSSIVIAFFSHFPTYTNYSLGQVSFFLLLPLVCAWRALRQEKHIQTGIWLGIATALKPFFGIFMLILIAGGYSKAALMLALTTAVISLTALVIFGYQTYADYATIAHDITWWASSWNASLLGFFTRIMGGSENHPWTNLPGSAHCLYLASSLCAIIICIWRIKRCQPHNHGNNADNIFIITPPLMILTSPLGWLYYFPLIALSAALALEKATNKQNLYAKILLITCLLITGIPRSLETARMMNTPEMWWWHGPMYSYILLIYLLIVLWLIDQKNNSLI